LTAALCFPTRVLDTPVLASADRSLVDSPFEDRAETAIVRIGMSPSNTGMGEIKLSRACIRTHRYKILRHESISQEEGALPGPF
jgi:hypothetical protein